MRDSHSGPHRPSPDKHGHRTCSCKYVWLADLARKRLLETTEDHAARLNAALRISGRSFAVLVAGPEQDAKRLTVACGKGAEDSIGALEISRIIVLLVLLA